MVDDRMDFHSLPREIVHNVISCQSLTLTDLRNCSLVCRNMWEAACAVIYRHIDLEMDEAQRYDLEANKRTRRRQLVLFTSIASNTQLGAYVRIFKNYRDYYPWPVHHDATIRAGADINQTLVQAAQNMWLLSKASFTANPLSIQVITNLPSYPQLTDLSIAGVDPEEHIWNIAPISLKKLKWEVPIAWYCKTPWDAATFLVKVVESTCPDLQSLDISFSYTLPRQSPTITNIINQYRGRQASSAPKLMNLRHFGFKFQDSSPAGQIALEAGFHDFVARHSQSLKSVSIPTSYEAMTREALDFILGVCVSLPHLTELILSHVTEFDLDQLEGLALDGRKKISGLQFITELTSTLASPRYEIGRLSVGNIGVPFSSDVGKFFASWKSLKFLQAGDNDGSFSLYVDEGLDFKSYTADILQFIKELSQSLQELCLEINFKDAWFDEDFDFDPVCDFESEIFLSLRKLHTCDIHAWIFEPGIDVRKIPKKAVFYRRISSYNENIKDIWTSRGDYIDYEIDTIVVKSRQQLEGRFEGEDAGEAWCGGFVTERWGPNTC